MLETRKNFVIGKAQYSIPARIQYFVKNGCLKETRVILNKNINDSPSEWRKNTLHTK